MRLQRPEDLESHWAGERVTLGRHFLRDLEGLWAGVLKLAAVVEDALNRSVRALCDGRADLAEEVKGEERTVDRWEVQIERDCLKILALHQPVACDLRRVAAVLKINGNLERISNLARNIAKRVKKQSSDDAAAASPRSPSSSNRWRWRPWSRSATVSTRWRSRTPCSPAPSSPATAGSIAATAPCSNELKGEIRRDPERLNHWLRLINTARNLERIADHATSIAEAVVYLKEGDIVRHAEGNL